MITKIHYKNFKALRDTTLPLGRFTLIVGANGSGKTSAMQALSLIDSLNSNNFNDYLSKGETEESKIEIEVFWKEFSVRTTIFSDNDPIYHFLNKTRNIVNGGGGSIVGFLEHTHKRKNEADAIRNFRIFSFDAVKVAEQVPIRRNINFESDGSTLAGILDQIYGNEPEKFEELNKELHKWLPEFDRILFETTTDGFKSFLLRTKNGKHKIKAVDLSHGTRLAIAFLTVAHLPNPPQIVCFEEPERGIHPRLLRNIQEAMDRLAYPEEFGEKREPVQVIATTHSPYLLDLYKDRREEIVIANKDEKGVHFNQLIKLPHIEEILKEQDAPLGDIWYSGILGGVPA